MASFSSTKITPANGQKIPTVDGSTTGYIVTEELKSYILADTSELEQRVDTLEAEVSTLKSGNRIQGIKIENLEAMAEGKIKVDHTEDTTDGSLDLPSGTLAPYAEVEKVMGKSVAWNQLAPSATSTTDWNMYDSSKISLSNDDGGIKATFRAEGSGYAYGVRVRNQIPTTIGHVYICTTMIKTEAGLNFDCEIDNVGVSSLEGTLAVNQWNPYTFVGASNRAYTYLLIKPKTALTVGQSYWVKDAHFVDLTTLFGVTSVSQVTAFMRELVRAYADAHPQYTDGEIVDSTLTEVKSIGANLCDEVWESGYITDSGYSDNGNSIRSKNFIPCKPSTTYYKVKPSTYAVTVVVAWYDSAQNLIERGTGATSDTSPANAKYFKVSLYNYGTTYHNDIAVRTTQGGYVPYRTGFLTLPTLPPLRGAGTARDTAEIKERVYEGMNTIDLSTLNWSGSADRFWYSDSLPYGIKLSSEYGFVGDVTDGNMATMPYGTMANNADKSAGIKVRSATRPTGIIHYETTSGGETYKARVLERKCASIVFDGNADEVWSQYTTSSIGNNGKFWRNLTNNWKNDGGFCPNVVNSYGLKNQNFSATSAVSGLYLYAPEGRVYVSMYDVNPTMSVIEWKAYLSQHPLEVVYGLASPQILDITDRFANYEPFIESEAYGTVSVISDGAQADATIHYQSQVGGTV